ncbi:hypothetical protein ACNJX9_34525 [Bradyrhizobium sp. DASA03076]|uniref:hypothetical protein n=1 Tax=Bradyrhizobium sp. BLXBL-03 TaxID=3395916 RepID=UPI003F720C69
MEENGDYRLCRCCVGYASSGTGAYAIGFVPKALAEVVIFVRKMREIIAMNGRGFRELFDAIWIIEGVEQRADGVEYRIGTTVIHI